mgnify:FL=1
MAENELDLRLAVLIDADNASRTAMKDVMAEVAVYGTPTIKRIYGDWTSPNMSTWKSILLECALTPIQQYGYTTGKNSTDSAMIIDAMDILYSGNCDGFVLVSSDSDFTRLAIRLREAGMKVYGMGEKKTPTAFISACNKFKYLEILAQPAETVSATQRRTEEMTPLETVKNAVLSIMDEISDEDEWVSISEIGSRLNKRYPDFDVRNYGFRKLTPFIKSLGILDIRSVPVNEGNSRLVYVKVRS